MSRWLDRALAASAKFAETAKTPAPITGGRHFGSFGNSGTASQRCPLGSPTIHYLDGRVAWVFRCGRGETTEDARELVRDATAAGCVLVADGEVLRITAPRDVSADLLERIANQPAHVLAELHHASDLRFDNE